MKKLAELRQRIESDRFSSDIQVLYGTDPAVVEEQKKRYLSCLDAFQEIFPESKEVAFYSAPGRTEIGGNHTDHQNGRVLAAAVNLDIVGVAAKTDSSVIRLQSKGFSMNVVDLSDLRIQENEKGGSNSLIRGIAARFTDLGYQIGGMDIYTTSDVLKGSGLSSSAAFEVLIGTIFSHEFCNGEVDAVEIAKISKYAENHYFGKASGLMDQMVSSVGSFVAIDFADTEKPLIEKVDYDLAQSGHALCITDTKGSHANLTADYVAVPFEMKSVAEYFGKDVLREVPAEDFYKNLPELREKVSDRAVLRAIHFYHDNETAKEEADALKQGDFALFQKLVRNSGKSSFQYLQNVYSPAHPEEQGVSLGLAISEEVLGDAGACRVHGGGFAGTIQAFVPFHLLGAYKARMEELFGAGSCYILNIREAGGTKIAF